MYSNVGPLHADSIDRLLAQKIPSWRGFASIRVKYWTITRLLPIVTNQQPLNNFIPDRLSDFAVRILEKMSSYDYTTTKSWWLIESIWDMFAQGDEQIICIMRPPEHWQ
ncbi:hypothetical protein BCON_0035g00110 [Botryotinia convoluta]|uniref:Uncharacterized protein n=1 Tax=Botryotinia convoluta TaxID=54673 RepID=A0A4Z1IGC4_9HELO|nr:hypothetical protein BCON_0035g00110 [Botryotinia convoluta]